MARFYERGQVVSVANPYAEAKLLSAVILTDDRRPLHDDGEWRYTIIMLTGDQEAFGEHDWTVTLDAEQATKEGAAPLLKDSIVEPWATYVVRHTSIHDVHTELTREAMKSIAKAYVKMIIQ